MPKQHSQANTIGIELTSADMTLTLSVTDDDIGLPETRSQANGMGLRLMHYRASLIGANLKIERRSGGGNPYHMRRSGFNPVSP